MQSIIENLPAIINSLAALVGAVGTVITAIGVIVVAYYQYLGNHQRKEILAENAKQTESMQQIVNK